MLLRMVSFLLLLYLGNPVYATPAPSPVSTAPASFKLKSPNFGNQGSVPTIYTCDGDDISPPLSWKGAPEQTQSFALIVSDPDAPKGTWYHWLVFNIPNDVQELSVGVSDMSYLPEGTQLGRNSWDRIGYNGPCPPMGSMHSYIFTLYALDRILSLPEGVGVETLLAEVTQHTLAKTQLQVFYSRLPSIGQQD